MSLMYTESEWYCSSLLAVSVPSSAYIIISAAKITADLWRNCEMCENGNKSDTS